jgi:hypothetical protein
MKYISFSNFININSVMLCIQCLINFVAIQVLEQKIILNFIALIGIILIILFCYKFISDRSLTVGLFLVFLILSYITRLLNLDNIVIWITYSSLFVNLIAMFFTHFKFLKN